MQIKGGLNKGGCKETGARVNIYKLIWLFVSFFAWHLGISNSIFAESIRSRRTAVPAGTTYIHPDIKKGHSDIKKGARKGCGAEDWGGACKSARGDKY